MTLLKNYKAYAVKKRAEIIADTVKLLPYKYPMMESYTENGTITAAKDINEFLQNPQPESPMEIIGNKQGHDPEQIVRIMIKYNLETSLRV